jgi:anti-sigma B factor antagonist
MATTELDTMTDAVPRPLRVTLGAHGTTTTISLSGEWDMAWQASMRSQFQAVLERCPETIMLDLRDLSFIDSTGIHGVLEFHERTVAQNVRLVIVPGPPAVQRPFEMLGLTDALPFLAAPQG